MILIDKIIDDTNKIESIKTVGGMYFDGSDFDINPYLENGEMSHIVWFAIFNKNDEKVKYRINSKHVEYVEYA